MWRNTQNKLEKALYSTERHLFNKQIVRDRETKRKRGKPKIKRSLRYFQPIKVCDFVIVN